MSKNEIVGHLRYTKTLGKRINTATLRNCYARTRRVLIAKINR